MKTFIKILIAGSLVFTLSANSEQRNAEAVRCYVEHRNKTLNVHVVDTFLLEKCFTPQVRITSPYSSYPWHQSNKLDLNNNTSDFTDEEKQLFIELKVLQLKMEWHSYSLTSQNILQSCEVKEHHSNFTIGLIEWLGYDKKYCEDILLKDSLIGIFAHKYYSDPDYTLSVERLQAEFRYDVVYQEFQYSNLKARVWVVKRIDCFMEQNKATAFSESVIDKFLQSVIDNPQEHLHCFTKYERNYL